MRGVAFAILLGLTPWAGTAADPDEVTPVLARKCLRGLTHKWTYSAQHVVRGEFPTKAVADDGRVYLVPQSTNLEEIPSLSRHSRFRLLSWIASVFVREPQSALPFTGPPEPSPFAWATRPMVSAHLADERIRGVLAGTHQPALLILTHPSEGLISVMLRKLRSPEFLDTPRIALVSNLYPLPNPTLAGQVDLVLPSESGELPVPLRANVFHLLGGYADACLKKTLEEAVKENLTPTTPVTVYLHAASIYGNRGESLPLIFSGSPHTLRFEDYFGHPDEPWERASTPTWIETPFGRGLRYEVPVGELKFDAIVVL